MVLGCNGKEFSQATCKNKKCGPIKSPALEGIGMLQQKKVRNNINGEAEMWEKMISQKKTTDDRQPPGYKENPLCNAVKCMPEAGKIACRECCESGFTSGCDTCEPYCGAGGCMGCCVGFPWKCETCKWHQSSLLATASNSSRNAGDEVKVGWNWNRVCMETDKTRCESVGMKCTA